MNLFEKRSIIIATKHGKEQVIGPILQEKLGLNWFVDSSFDSDQFGTFTGEIKRSDDAFSTVRQKCLAAMQHARCDLGIASEGSFGTHPTYFFSKANEEIILLIDLKNGLEIVARSLSTETNLDGMYLETYDDLNAFATACQFPSHGLILRTHPDASESMVKGIDSWELLRSAFTALHKKHGRVYVETDMRAMHNPTRMKHIESVAQQLITKIQSTCPSCKTPGFSVQKVIRGLRCTQCNHRTQRVLSHVSICQKCNFTTEKKYPYGKQTEDPMFCDVCNP